MRIIFFLWFFSLVLSGFSQSVVSNEDKSTRLTSIEPDDFDIIFQQDMEKTPVGPLSREQWALDWQNPEFANGVYTGDYTIIEDIDKGELKSRVMHWTFPEGTYSADDNHGYQWKVPFGGSYDEIYLTYSIMFKPGFEPVLGGKIPGLEGGLTKSGTAGNGPPDWDDGFGGSLMFKQGPSPVFYIYHHDMPGLYGETRGWGYTFDVSTDIWYDITFRIVMNTATATELGGPDGLNDGIMEGFVNGILYGSWTNLRLRNLYDIGIDHARIQGFFGGGDSDWATIRDEWMLIDNVFVWKYSNQFLENNPSVKRGIQANPMRGEILTPRDVDWSGGVIPSPDDTEPPSVPNGLHAIDSTDSSITIAWEASQDNVGVTDYKVFLDGTAIGATYGTEYPITSLEPSRRYSISVSANDLEKNESPRSSSIYVTTLNSDREPPTIPTGISISNVTGNTMLLSWQPSTDNIGVEKYSIYLDQVWISDETSTSYKVTGLQPNTDYELALRSYDKAGNSSPLSSSVLMRTTDPDDEPPSVPTGLIETDKTQKTISLAWNPSTDNVGVREYYVYVNNELRGKSSEPSETIAQLSSGINYSISVSAVDEALNESRRSSEINVTTVNGDITTSPVLPTVDIIDISANTFNPSSTSEIESFGYTELVNYGIEVSISESPMKDPIILNGTNSSEGLVGERVEDGLIAFYNFSEGEGDIVEDLSKYGTPMNLKIKQEGVATQWLIGQGLRLLGNTIIEYEGSPNKLIDEISRTDEITMEVWIKQESINQSGPARIITLSEGTDQRAITIGHEGNNSIFNYNVRLSTSFTGVNGLPQLSTQLGFFSETLHHVIYTRSMDGTEEIYVNGWKLASGNKIGNFASWSDANRFALGNEISLDRPWKGIFYLAAVYNRAFSEEDVLTNYNAGIGPIQFSIQLDTLDPNVNYTLIPFVSTDQGVVYGDAKEFIYRNVTLIDTVLAFYPNPNNGTFSVIIKKHDKDLKQAFLRIADLAGHIHYSTELDLSEWVIEKKFRIELPATLESGFYVLILVAGSNSVAQKLVLMR
jgi:chitodextrinase